MCWANRGFCTFKWYCILVEFLKHISEETKSSNGEILNSSNFSASMKALFCLSFKKLGLRNDNFDNWYKFLNFTTCTVFFTEHMPDVDHLRNPMMSLAWTHIRKNLLGSIVTQKSARHSRPCPASFVLSVPVALTIKDGRILIFVKNCYFEKTHTISIPLNLPL